jgi:Tol biopolymer transport system component
MDFQDLQRRYDELRERFEAGEIGEEEFRGELEGLQLKDEQGVFWTIGAQTGEWYRFDGSSWAQETPTPMTKHQGRGVPEHVSAQAAAREADSSRPGWLYTGCAGLLVLLVVAGLIIGAVTLLRGRDTAVSSGQVATATLSAAIPANTPTLGPTPSPTATVLSTDTPVAPRAYSNNAFGINLQYPGDWQVKESRQEVTFAPDAPGLAASIIDDVSVTEGVSYVVARESDSITQDPEGLLAQFIAGLPTDASSAETGIRTVEQVEWAISQINLDAPDSAQEMTAYVAATYLNGSAYTVFSVAPSTDWDTFAPVFQEMFDSLQLTGAPVAAAIAPSPTVMTTLTLTATVVPTRSTPASPSGTPTPIVYVIEQGDTLGAIAFRYDVSVEAIQAANGIDDPATLQVGQELVIPGEGSIPATARAATTTPEVTSEATPETAPTPEPTPTPAPVALSGKIVFPVFDPNKRIEKQVGGFDIWMSDPQGNNIQVLVPDASQPHLNPGGDLLAYRSWNPRGRGVAFLTIGGGRGDILTNFLEDGLPSWAPDSYTVAFASRREGDRISRIYRVNQASGEEHSLGLIGNYVSTFPDGRLVFKGCTVEGMCGMFISGPEGGTFDLISDNTSDTAPAPSPDGTRIAFMSLDRDGAGNWEIFVMDSNGGNVTRLTNDKGNDGLPAWSPDGSTIAFASDRDGAWGIWAMNPDGSDQRKLFNMGGSPDGVVGFDVDNSKGWEEERISWGR